MQANQEQKKNRLKQIRKNWLIDNLHRNFEEEGNLWKVRQRARDNLETTK